MPADRLSHLLGAALLAVACSDSAGDPPGAGQDGGLDAAADAAGEDASACTLTKPYSSSDSDCDACAEQACCAQVNACYASPDCDDGYVNCILGCALLPDDAGDAGLELCTKDCGAQFPAGASEYEAAVGCVDAHCASACE